MNKTALKKIWLPSILCIAITVLAFHVPITCHGEDIPSPLPLVVDFSPNIINIDSEREGDIRILTRMRYSTFVADGDSIFIFFNDYSESVQNIRAGRDSLGNLILRFALYELQALQEGGQDCLLIDAYNTAEVVITMKDGVEYSGSDEEVYIIDKKASEK